MTSKIEMKGYQSISGKTITVWTPQIDFSFLLEDEIYCSKCEGVGFVLQDLKYLAVCPFCNHGVVNICPNCKQKLSKNKPYCDNPICRKIREEKAEEIRIERATILKHDDKTALAFNMMYSDFYSYNEGYFSDWDEFFDDWKNNNSQNEEDGSLTIIRPKYVWGTSSSSIGIDVENILIQATEDLHEDAYDNLTDINELEDFVKQWCDKQTGTETYYQDFKYAIQIPWHLY